MIPLCEPNLSGKEKEYLSEAISTGWVSGNGPFVERFEEMVAKASGRRWAVATTTGTAALHAAFLALRPREVTIPSYLYIAAANAAKLNGTPLKLCDVPMDWTYDRGIIDMPAETIWDAAPAIGQEVAGKLACFSFNGNKTITTGQGGAVVGDEEYWETSVRHVVNVSKTGMYTHDGLGMNYRMPNLNAAMGCAQMERLEDFLEAKHQIARRYFEALGYGFPLDGSCWMSGLRVDCPDKLAEKLQEDEIDARRFWVPIHRQSSYRNVDGGPFCNSEYLSSHMLCLPCSTTLTRDQQDKVIRCVESLR